jgi:hypothetical protein
MTGGDCPFGEDADERICVISLIANQSIWVGVLEQRLRASQIMRLAWREHQLDRIAQGVDERVIFGGQSAA